VGFFQKMQKHLKKGLDTLGGGIVYNKVSDSRRG